MFQLQQNFNEQNLRESQLISSVHGRDRRLQRQIGKHDLIAAVRFGVKQPGYRCRRTGRRRWKYTFANVVYITDETSTEEITSYILPLVINQVPVSLADQRLHDYLGQMARNRPQKCTSHTILVIDQSASMKTCDVENFKTRSDAVYGTVALELIGKQIDAGEIRGTDILSLLEMNDDATEIFLREPITNVLFNKILERQQTAKPRSHGNYYESLCAVDNILSQDENNSNCALLVLFLSDGKPSDHCSSRYLNQHMAEDRINAKVCELAKRFGKRLTFGTIGFCHQECDTIVLQNMASSATSSGAQGNFYHSGLCSTQLSSVVSNLSARLTVTKTQLSHLGQILPSTERAIQKEEPLTSHKAQGWKVYLQQVQLVRWDEKQQDWNYDYSFLSPEARGVGVREKYFARGAERIVYELTEISAEREILGHTLVGKECRFVEDEYKKMNFHKDFCKTQLQAGRLANKFNIAVRKAIAASHIMGKLIPVAEIHFLECYVYEYEMDDGTLGGILAEKKLDHSRWKKWNGNDGYVDGAGLCYDFMKLSIDDEVTANNKFSSQHRLANLKLDDIIEESEEESEDDDNQEDHCLKENGEVFRIKLDDFPQAFSHFSYRATNRKKLVCDLQGVLNQASSTPIFELTDPVIHFASSRGRKNVYGRTDHGSKGIHNFFKTHICNDVCRLLNLPSDKGFRNISRR